MFDLLNQPPDKLDAKTLNYVWDRLWRSNAAFKPANAAQRAIYDERKRILAWLDEQGKATGEVAET